MEKTYEKTLHLCPTLIAVYSLKSGEYDYVSNEAINILGISKETFKEGGLEFVMSLVHPEDRDRIMEENQAALEFIQSNRELAKSFYQDFKYRMQKNNGEYVWVKTRGRVFEFDEYGQVEKIINFTKEITPEELFKETNELIEVPEDFGELINDYCHHLNNSLQILQFLKNEMSPEYRTHLESTFNRLVDISTRLQQI